MENIALQTDSFRSAGRRVAESGGGVPSHHNDCFLCGGGEWVDFAASLTFAPTKDAGHAGDAHLHLDAASTHGPRQEPGPVSGPTLLRTRSLGFGGLDNYAAGPVRVSAPLLVSAPPSGLSSTPASSCPPKERVSRHLHRHPEWRASYLNRPLPPIPRRPVPARARSAVGFTLFPRVTAFDNTETSNTTTNSPSHIRSKSVGNIDTMSGADRSKRMSRDDMFLSRSTTAPTQRFNKRISRDDMDLGRYRAASTSDRRGPPISMRGHQVAASQSSIQHEPAMLSTMRESTQSGDIPIGMALGSPSHAPPSRFPMGAPAAAPIQIQPASRWQPQVSSDSRPSSSSRPPSSSGTAVTSTSSGPVPQRTKTGRRKLFSIFSSGSKKQAKQEEKLTQSQPSLRRPGTSGTISRGSEISVTTSANPSFDPMSVPGRSATITNNKSAPRYQPLIVRTNTEPFGPASGNSRAQGVRPTLKSKISEPAIRQPGMAMPTFNVQPPSDSRFQSSYLGSSGAVYLSGGVGGKPFLPLELPDYKMERYSVMFSGLLNPKSETEKKRLEEEKRQQQQSAPSLLARRQAAMKELKCIDEKVAREHETRMHSRNNSSISAINTSYANNASLKVNTSQAEYNGNDDYIQPQAASRQRRATSPQPTKSPAFVLFPPPPSAKKLSPVPGGLSRSNTSPAILPSPVRFTFEQQQLQSQPGHYDISRRPIEAAPQRRALPGRQQTQDSYLSTGPANPLRSNPNPTYSYYNDPTPGSSIFSPSQSSLILDSPTSMDSPSSYGASPVASAPRGALNQPQILSPQWQMVTSTSATQNSSSASSSGSGSEIRRAQSPPSSISSTQTAHWPQPPRDPLAIEETDLALKTAVESSIARQISLSRQQRQLLRPLQTQGHHAMVPTRKPSRTAMGVESMGVESPVMGMGMGSGMGTPSPAWISETKSSTPTLVTPPVSGGGPWRKSERVVLEAA